MSEEKWYKKCYRRHLMDMHIEDWSDEFLSNLDVDEYYDNLVKAKIQSPMIYLQSHVGLCNFDTKTAKKHKALEKDNKIKRLVKKCIDGGMKVVGYYSLIYNTWAELNHKDWAMRYPSGLSPTECGSRYGLCCPNNADYRKFVEEQIKEFSSQFEGVSGIFFDMPYWPLACQCDACQKRWEKEVGGTLPKQEDFNDENWLLYLRKAQLWMAEFTTFIKQTTNKYMPGVTVEMNYAGVIAFDWACNGETELINENCEFAGGDLYGDLYNHSFTAKYYYDVTKNQPFEYMVGRCDNVLQEHTISKSYNQLRTELSLTAIHHGANFVIDALDPRGTLDTRVYERLGKIFEELLPLEKYYDGEMIADIGVFYDSKAIFNSNRGYLGCNRISAIKTTRKLIENHIPVSVMANTTLHKINNYKAVFAGELEDFYPEYEDAFIQYVRDGGSLYLSGKSNKRLMKEFFGATFKAYTKETKTYVRPCAGCDLLGEFIEKYPMPLNYALPIFEVEDESVVRGKITLPYTDPKNHLHFASIHSNPPGIDTDYPGLMIVNYGKGKVIWSASAIEQEDRAAFKEVFDNLTNALLEGKDLSISALLPKTVEVVSFRAENSITIGLLEIVNHEDNIKKNYVLRVKSSSPAQKVVNLPDETPIDFGYENGEIVIKGEMENFKMLKIDL